MLFKPEDPIIVLFQLVVECSLKIVLDVFCDDAELVMSFYKLLVHISS